jgi:hypothetical protein
VGDWPYLWLDATYLKQREGGRIISGGEHRRQASDCLAAYWADAYFDLVA